MCPYGDPAYLLRAHLQGPFRGAALTQDQKSYDTAMNGACTAVEWVFGDMVNYFKFLDLKKNLKVGLSAVGKTYVDCALIQNAHTILSISLEYFSINPPPLDGYFIE